LSLLFRWTVLGFSTVLQINSSAIPSYQQRKQGFKRIQAIHMASDKEEVSPINLPEPPNSSLFDSLLSLRRTFSQASAEGFGTKARNVAKTMSVGDVIVPLCGNLSQRQILANRGIYPGVEYKVCSLRVDNVPFSSMQDVPISGKGDVIAQIKPAYKLRKHLERKDWPVEVNPLKDVPLWLSKTTYEAGTLVGTLGLSVSYLVLAGIVAFFVRFAYVPSPSMQPSLNPGDVVLVTRTVWPFQPSIGDVVLFDPPVEFKNTIEASGIMQQENSRAALPGKGQQFLKRVVAKEGEYVGVKNSEPFVNLSMKNGNDVGIPPKQRFRVDIVGPYVQPDVFPVDCWNRSPEQLGKNKYFVAGDNGYRSVDSRVWGPLDGKYILGSARLVVWPLDHFGPVKEGQIFTIEK
jgi:signal peptidase I, bacterial type